MKRVVITGVGMVSSIGTNVIASWNALLSGKSGIKSYKDDPILKNTNEYNLALITDFKYEDWKVSFANNRMNSFLHCAFQQSLKDSKFNIQKQQMNTGICLGIMGSNVTKISEAIQNCSKTSYQKINRLIMMQLLMNIPPATLMTKYSLKGPSQSVSSACASALSAIGTAYRWIQLGEADSAFAGGLEQNYNPISLNSSIKVGAMSIKKYQKPQYSSRPFDKERSGFIIGQGAGVILLEEYQKAKARKAKIYAQIVGYACNSDGFHLTRPLQSGDRMERVMRKAIDASKISVDQIDHINCHATSTNAGDQIQAKAIYNLLSNDENRKRVTITANKGNVGHTFGAAGCIQLIFGLLSMQNNLSPKILNLCEPPNIKLNYNFENTKQEINYMLKNSFGFGGINTTLVLKKIG